MDINSLNETLFSLKKDSKLKNPFPNSCEVIGVPVPELRKIAKTIAKDNYIDFLEKCPNDIYFEHQLLKAFVIGYAKDDITEILKHCDKFIPTIHDWAVCDSLCTSLVIAKKNREMVWNWLQKYINGGEFSQRVVAVISLSHFLTDDYINKVLDTMNKLKNQGYYTKMSIAWCVATAYAKYPQETMTFLKDNQLDNWTFNKSIQKAIESYRVPLEDKSILKNMKKT